MGEMKRADQNKPYDTKKSVWIPDEKTGGYKEGLLESGDLEDPASKCVVAVAHEKFTLKGALVGQVNPPKFEKCEDMVNLTYLNDASVFWNLKTRYQAKLIRACNLNPTLKTIKEIGGGCAKGEKFLSK